MNHHENIKILAFIGAPGAGKTTALTYLLEKQYPKLTGNDIISQIEHLAEAGQHRLITDELTSMEQLKTVKHTFPGELFLIGIVTPKHQRFHRLEINPGSPENQGEASLKDWQETEDGKTELLAIADYYLDNSSGIDELYKNIDVIVDEIGFTN